MRIRGVSRSRKRLFFIVIAVDQKIVDGAGARIEFGQIFILQVDLDIPSPVQFVFDETDGIFEVKRKTPPAKPCRSAKKNRPRFGKLSAR